MTSDEEAEVAEILTILDDEAQHALRRTTAREAEGIDDEWAALVDMGLA